VTSRAHISKPRSGILQAFLVEIAAQSGLKETVVSAFSANNWTTLHAAFGRYAQNSATNFRYFHLSLTETKLLFGGNEKSVVQLASTVPTDAERLKRIVDSA